MEVAHADQNGEGVDCLPKGIRTCDADFSHQPALSCRRTICFDRSNSEVLAFGCQNLREAWAKRRYEAHFVSKLTDYDGENAETDTSLDFATNCSYINVQEHAELSLKCEEIGKMLGSMMKNPKSFLI